MSDAAAPGVGDVGFIGLGVMGEPMCANLARNSGRPVAAFDLDSAPLSRLASAGVHRCASIAEVAASADIVFLSLPSAVEVEAVCLGAAGIAAARGRTRTIVDMSTSAVEATRRIATTLAGAGIEFVDAPVARTRAAAQAGTLLIMVGSSDAQFRAVEPLLACMGSDVVHCGPVGNGQVVKILNNMVLFMTGQALAEALVIGERAGVEGAQLFAALARGSADSFALRNHGMMAMVPGDFPEKAFPTDYALKDIRLALALAEGCGVEARGARLTANLLQETSAAGLGGNYWPVLVKLIERAGRAGSR
jgi:3-hydroxyisobutyrate dehydrogenase-like beta-hydroxyacid dehydrogenase